MTRDERIAKAHRAKLAWDEFFGPMTADMKAAYGERIVEVANLELSRNSRADKITALSNAIRIVENLEAGMKAIIEDGDVATQDKARAKRIEDMSRPQSRLLRMVPGY